MTSLDAEALKQLLTRNWMTHDAMWFVHSLQAVGMQQTNQINKAAVRAMAMFEAKRILRAFDLPQPKTLTELETFFTAAMGVVVGDFAEYVWRWDPAGSSLHAEFTRCFAHEGIVRMGVEDTYECGIFERIFGWLDHFGIDHRIEPEQPGCLMVTHGRCRKVIHLDLPS